MPRTQRHRPNRSISALPSADIERVFEQDQRYTSPLTIRQVRVTTSSRRHLPGVRGSRPKTSTAGAENLSRPADVFVLVAWEGLSYAATAEALAIPIGTVRSRLARVRRLLRLTDDQEATDV